MTLRGLEGVGYYTLRTWYRNTSISRCNVSIININSIYMMERADRWYAMFRCLHHTLQYTTVKSLIVKPRFIIPKPNQKKKLPYILYVLLRVEMNARRAPTHPRAKYVCMCVVSAKGLRFDEMPYSCLDSISMYVSYALSTIYTCIWYLGPVRNMCAGQESTRRCCLV